MTDSDKYYDDFDEVIKKIKPCKICGSCPRLIEENIAPHTPYFVGRYLPKTAPDLVFRLECACSNQTKSEDALMDAVDKWNDGKTRYSYPGMCG